VMQRTKLEERSKAGAPPRPANRRDVEPPPIVNGPDGSAPAEAQAPKAAHAKAPEPATPDGQEPERAMPDFNALSQNMAKFIETAGRATAAYLKPARLAIPRPVVLDPQADAG
jgi:hypothetical protein